jgi:hypothetical protein
MDSNKLNLLKKAKLTDVRWDPYPHFVIEDALDEDVYAELEATYPSSDKVRDAKHVANRDQLTALDVLNNEEIAPIWREFTKYTISAAFYQDLAKLFGPFVQDLYPWLETEKGKKLSEFSVGPRDPNEAYLPDVCLDCQPGLNVVSMTPMSVRSAHLDASNKLFTGLLYMRVPGDDSTGGDFNLYRPKHIPPLFDSKTTVPEDELEIVHTVPYKRNMAVFFMNSPLSIHGVSVRSGTTIPRRLVNIVAGLYTLQQRELFPAPPTEEAFVNTRFSAPVYA